MELTPELFGFTQTTKAITFYRLNTSKNQKHDFNDYNKNFLDNSVPIVPRFLTKKANAQALNIGKNGNAKT